MAHFYRGELGRIMAWRARAGDDTTNWAITGYLDHLHGCASRLSRVPHIIFFFNVGIVWIMLWIEARRYRFLRCVPRPCPHARGPLPRPDCLAKPAALLQGEWQPPRLRRPAATFLQDQPAIEADGRRRLKRNYGFIFLIVLVAWITKIFLHPRQPITGFKSFYHALGGTDASIPGWFVATLFVSTFASVVGIRIFCIRQKVDW